MQEGVHWISLSRETQKLLFLQNCVFWGRKVERQFRAAGVPPSSAKLWRSQRCLQVPTPRNVSAVGSVAVAISSLLALPEEHRQPRLLGFQQR